ncbi:MAG: isoprenyl transferase [Deltaproteobacteria bacterium]|nr:isoprenyl transferase [Deltaproteobacteria bacterium]MBW1929578.1 isoprenyl transferase [Deltaproteobacteria bacterium]MBW2025089.1 isoprenyl transferase [Deltaproteobacteria bacterium]MBW2124999.1 isoprenyl transferase [Deltaproteobacteria bacterium]
MDSIDKSKLPTHVAIIMDGNGRWAKRRGLPRVRGHQQGAETVREVVRTTRQIGIPWLTLYAFSMENWKRSDLEVRALMNLLEQFLKDELEEMTENGIRLKAIGRLEKLPTSTRKLLFETMDKTSQGEDMTLTLALSYGGRQEILDAVRKIAVSVEKKKIQPKEIDHRLLVNALYQPEMPDPDLLIRTSGEYRISNFLLWQIAYTEIYITSTLWPDFTREEYLKAIAEFQNRERRFGAAD